MLDLICCSRNAGKSLTAEGSPVYVNDEGECVTDLAYYHPFVEAGANEVAAYNPFDSSIMSTSGAPINDAANFSMGKKYIAMGTGLLNG